MMQDGYASFLEYLTEKHLELPSYSADEFLYGHNGPTPQIARDHPFGQVPQILDIPEFEQDEWDAHVRSYYRGEWFSLQLGEAREWRQKRWEESGGHGYRRITDAEFTRLMTEGLYSKFLCKGLDPQDEARFAALLRPGVDYWKSDYSCMEAIKVLRDRTSYHASTVVLLERKAGGDFEVLSIHLRYFDTKKKEFVEIPETLEPGDGDAWELAKYFVLQGAIHRINLIDHGKVHFPGDVINAITKTALPKNHLVHQLLMPHFWLTLPVNSAVLEGERSLISRNSTYAYSPFVAEKLEVRRLLSLGWYGWRYYWKGTNRAYPAYTFKEGSPDHPSVYGKYMQDCYGPIRDFVGEVVELLPAEATADDWIEIQGWAAQISGWLPGFPEWPNFVFDDESGRTRADAVRRLADVIATVIHNASVVHSCDHASLHHMIQDDPVPFILRVPPPLSKQHTAELPPSLGRSLRALFDFSAKSDATPKDFVPNTVNTVWANGAAILCRPEDLESTCSADLLFYRAHNSSLLIDCEYDFEKKKEKKLYNDAAAKAAIRYRTALKALSFATKDVVQQYKLPWINPEDSPEYPKRKDDRDKFRKRHCIGAGIQY